MISTILVTGCGGDIGQGLGRILKISALANRIIGCDIHPNHPGSDVFDKCYVVDKASSVNYWNSLKRLMEKESIDLVIPTSESELRTLLNSNIISQEKQLLTPSLKALEIGLDKLKTIDFLKSNGIAYPWTKEVKKGKPLALPCIIKSRSGCGSRDVNIVSEGTVDYYQTNRPDDIWQEYLYPDDEEYTCGLYRSESGDIRTLIIKRKLQGGFTGSGIIVENRDIEGMLNFLAEALNLKGSINVQLRLTKNGPMIFEINPRFSSTVVFRHLLGFSDVVWSVMDHYEKPLPEYNPPCTGTRLYRVSREVIISPGGKNHECL